MDEEEQKNIYGLDLTYYIDYDDDEEKTILRWHDFNFSTYIKRLIFDNNITDYLFLLKDKNKNVYGCWFLGLRKGIWSIYRFTKKENEIGFYIETIELKDAKRCCVSFPIDVNGKYYIVKSDKEAFIFDPDKFKKKSDTFKDLIKISIYQVNTPIIFIKEVTDPYLGTHKFYGQVSHDGIIMPKIYNNSWEKMQDAPLINNYDIDYNILNEEELRKSIEGYGMHLLEKENRIYQTVINSNKQAIEEETKTSSERHK